MLRSNATLSRRQALLVCVKHGQSLSYLSPQSCFIPIDLFNRDAAKVAQLQENHRRGHKVIGTAKHPIKVFHFRGGGIRYRSRYELCLIRSRPRRWNKLFQLRVAAVPGSQYVNLASWHLTSSDRALGLRRWNENGKVKRLDCRLRPRNDSRVNMI